MDENDRYQCELFDFIEGRIRDEEFDENGDICWQVEQAIIKLTDMFNRIKYTEQRICEHDEETQEILKDFQKVSLPHNCDERD